MYAATFSPEKPHARQRRGNVDLVVQRHHSGRHVAFVGGRALGVGPTRAAALDAAYAVASRTPLSGATVAAAARAERKQTEAGAEIRASADLRRIFSLPQFQCPEFPPALETAFSAPDAPHARLRPFQLWALYHAAFIAQHYPGRGIIVSAGVGHGKTLVGLLCARVFQSERPVMVVPAALVQQWKDAIRQYTDQGFVFPVPAIVSHESLGAPTGATALDDLRPDLVVIDEADAFANGRSTRSRRLAAWKTNAPNARLVCMSGTLLRSSLHDVAGLASMTLGDLSPIPLHYPDLEAVASAVDADARLMRCRPGVLRQFAPPGMENAADVTVARAALRAILHDRLGYVTVRPEHRAAGETSAPLSYRFLRTEHPAAVTSALGKLDADWVHPISGDVISEALEHHRASVELSLGYATRWNPPPPAEWDEPRRLAAKALRKVRARKGLDSPGSWARALRAGKAPPADVDLGDEINPDVRPLREIWDAWVVAAATAGTSDAVGQKYPGSERVVTWLDDYAIRAAVAWGRESPGLIWTRSPAIGEAIAAAGGWTYYGAGAISRGLNERTPHTTAVVSIPVNYKGKNLQHFSRNLIMQAVGSADVMEQLVGRTHRAGQAGAVTVEIFAPTEHAERAMMAVLRRSGFVDEVEGSAYKIWRKRRDLVFMHGAQDPAWIQGLEADNG